MAETVHSGTRNDDKNADRPLKGEHASQRGPTNLRREIISAGKPGLADSGSSDTNEGGNTKVGIGED
jgi:hypothetical protein